MNDILFIIGAGLSEDSGVSTFRNRHSDMGSPMPDYERILTFEHFQADPEGVWSALKGLFQSIVHAHYQPMSPTYECLQKLLIKFPNSFILSQNIDGLTDGLIGDEKVVKLHGDYKTARCVCKSCGMFDEIVELAFDDSRWMMCQGCDSVLRPNIVFYNEELGHANVRKVNKIVKKRFKYVLVIGTTLQFSYLRRWINIAKSKGAKVIHINSHGSDEYVENVSKHEEWLKISASEGLSLMIQNE